MVPVCVRVTALMTEFDWVLFLTQAGKEERAVRVFALYHIEASPNPPHIPTSNIQAS